MFELSFINCSIGPIVLPFSTEFVFKILALILITIFEVLNSYSTLESFEESALIKLTLTENKFTITVSSVLLPLALVDETILINLFAFAVLFPLDKLTEINSCFSWAVVDFVYTKPIAFPVIELTFVDEFSLLVFDSFSSFFSLTVHEDLPSSKIYFAFIMKNNVVLSIYTKVSTIFVFFNLKFSLTIINFVDFKYIEQLSSHLN